MSRIAKIPVEIAKGVTYTMTASDITVKVRLVKCPCTSCPP